MEMFCSFSKERQNFQKEGKKKERMKNKQTKKKNGRHVSSFSCVHEDTSAVM